MTVAQRASLRDQILDFLRNQREPVSVPTVELALRNEHFPADTFDVRDAVSELVREGKAEYVTGRDVQIVR